MACDRDNPLTNDLLAMGVPQSLPSRLLLEVGARAKLRWETLKNRHEA